MTAEDLHFWTRFDAIANLNSFNRNIPAATIHSILRKAELSIGQRTNIAFLLICTSLWSAESLGTGSSLPGRYGSGSATSGGRGSNCDPYRRKGSVKNRNFR